MGWSTLGTLTPNLLNWVTLNAPSGGELFRVTQSWVGEWPGTGYIRLRLLYADHQFYEDAFFETERIYSGPDERLIAIPFNPIMREAGYNVRYFQARFNQRARIYENANWQVTLDQFVRDPAEGVIDPSLDGVATAAMFFY